MTTERPYPNVAGGPGKRWAAYWPGGSRTQYLGSFDTAEEARIAVLEAQITHLESRLNKYRAEIKELA